MEKVTKMSTTGDPLNHHIYNTEKQRDVLEAKVKELEKDVEIWKGLAYENEDAANKLEAKVKELEAELASYGCGKRYKYKGDGGLIICNQGYLCPDCQEKKDNR